MLFNDPVNYTIGLGLLGIHDVVAFHILRHLFHVSACVIGQNFVGRLPYSQDFSGMNIDVGSLPGQSCIEG